jgi:hypothetical protein
LREDACLPGQRAVEPKKPEPRKTQEGRHIRSDETLFLVLASHKPANLSVPSSAFFLVPDKLYYRLPVVRGFYLQNTAYRLGLCLSRAIVDKSPERRGSPSDDIPGRAHWVFDQQASRGIGRLGDWVGATEEGRTGARSTLLGGFAPCSEAVAIPLVPLSCNSA